MRLGQWPPMKKVQVYEDLEQGLKDGVNQYLPKGK